MTELKYWACANCDRCCMIRSSEKPFSCHVGYIDNWFELVKKKDKPLWVIFKCAYCESEDTLLAGYKTVYYVECGKCEARGPVRAFKENAVAVWNNLSRDLQNYLQNKR